MKLYDLLNDEGLSYGEIEEILLDRIIDTAEKAISHLPQKQQNRLLRSHELTWFVANYVIDSKAREFWKAVKLFEEFSGDKYLEY